jgi:hypothetical protein
MAPNCHHRSTTDRVRTWPSTAMCPVIGRKETQTQVPRTHTLHDGFAVPPINEPLQRSKEALPSVPVDPTGTAAHEALACEAEMQTHIAASRMRWDRRRHLRHRNFHLCEPICQSHRHLRLRGPTRLP